MHLSLLYRRHVKKPGARPQASDLDRKPYLHELSTILYTASVNQTFLYWFLGPYDAMSVKLLFLKYFVYTHTLFCFVFYTDAYQVRSRQRKGNILNKSDVNLGSFRRPNVIVPCFCSVTSALCCFGALSRMSLFHRFLCDTSANDDQAGLTKKSDNWAGFIKVLFSPTVARVSFYGKYFLVFLWQPWKVCSGILKS